MHRRSGNRLKKTDLCVNVPSHRLDVLVLSGFVQQSLCEKWGDKSTGRVICQFSWTAVLRLLSRFKIPYCHHISPRPLLSICHVDHKLGFVIVVKVV